MLGGDAMLRVTRIFEEAAFTFQIPSRKTSMSWKLIYPSIYERNWSKL